MYQSTVSQVRSWQQNTSLSRRLPLVAFGAVLAWNAIAQAEVVIETVTVGYPGNALEWGGEPYGAVTYTYNIGKFEVTAGQYTEFLNAVAATDDYGLYNAEMDSHHHGCQITQNGTSGSHWYDFSGGTAEAPGSTAADWENRPVNYVSWGDAARFANWTHNGQPTGAQDLTTTEDGSYFLNGAMTDAELLLVVREPDATWVIPSVDEWYKAAYYDGGGDAYYDYPTGTDIVPSNVLSNPAPDPGNNANFWDVVAIGYTIGSPYYRTEVGDFENSESPSGTFDQGGNVFEWIDKVVGANRVLRGGSYIISAVSLHAHNRYPNDPTFELFDSGFRVAQLTEPVCGDTWCESPEDPCGCPQDCGQPNEVPGSTCADQIDNDCDTLTDCRDPDCLAEPGCCVDDADCPRCNVCFRESCVDSYCVQIPSRYGDVDGNGTVSIFDLFCILNGFGGDFSVCSFGDNDIDPCEGNGTINIFDLFAVLNAFGGTDPCCYCDPASPTPPCEYGVPPACPPLAP